MNKRFNLKYYTKMKYTVMNQTDVPEKKWVQLVNTFPKVSDPCDNSNLWQLFFFLLIVQEYFTYVLVYKRFHIIIM